MPQVRKAVVKILRDALLAHPNHPRRGAICQLLVSRASSPKEEDSIKDLVRRTFEVLWFDGRGDGADDHLPPHAQAQAAAHAQAASAAAAAATASPGSSPRTPRSSAAELDFGVALRQVNPKTPGTAGHARYEGYKAAATLRQLLELGGTRADFR
jgi:hypothetical protein